MTVETLLSAPSATPGVASELPGLRLPKTAIAPQREPRGKQVVGSRDELLAGSKILVVGLDDRMRSIVRGSCHTSPMAGEVVAIKRAVEWIRRQWIFALCMGLWFTLAATAAARAVLAGWYPVGDEALIAIRALDVFGPHHPLLGTAASVALGGGVYTNHPGPMLFDLVALPVQVMGVGSGLAVGIAFVNFLTGAIALVFAWRQGAARATVAVALGLCALVWSGGSQLLIDPYNPTVSMLPFFAVLVLSWALINRDLAAAPFLIAIGSFCVQTNIAYVITTIPVMCIALGWLAVSLVRDRRSGGDVVRLRRPLIASAAVLVACWIQPFIEQLLHGRDGNVARLVRAARVTEPPLGIADGTKRVAATFTIWPMWTRGSLDSYFFLDPGPSIVMSVVSLLAFIGVLLWLTSRLMRSRCDPAWTRLTGLAAIVVVVGWIAAIRVPLSPFYGFAADYVRWLWPIGVFATMSGVVAVVCLLEGRLHRWSRGHGLMVGVLAVVVAFAVAVPAGPDVVGNRESAKAVDTANALNDLGVDTFRDRPAVFDPRSPLYPIFGFALLAALNEHGQAFYVTDPVLIRQFGNGRVPPNGKDLSTFYIPVGWEALLSRGDAAAFASTMAPDDLERLEALLPAFVRGFDDGSITLTNEGRALARSGLGRPWMATLLDGGRLSRMEVFSNSDAVMTLLDNGMLKLPPELGIDQREFVDLSRDANLEIASIMWR